MDINVDNEITYSVNIQKLTDDLQQIYENHINKGIALPTGNTIDFNRKSLARLVLKQLMTPIVIPILESLFIAKGETLEKPEKHTDLIDFCVCQLLSFTGRHSDDIKLVVATKTSDTGIKTVSTVSTTRQDRGEQSGSTTTNETNETEETAEGR